MIRSRKKDYEKKGPRKQSPDHFFSQSFLRDQSGHTFLELIVVISIFAIISSVILFNFGDFSTNISVQNLSADIALTIKQAQSEAISGKSSGLSTPDSYAPTYGVAFDPTGHPSSFAYFIDLNNDRLLNDWDCGDPGSECLREISILTGDTVESEGLCLIDSTNCGIPDLSITFQRPFPDAVIKTSSGQTGSSGWIGIISARGLERRIHVNSLGQINLE